MIFHLKKTPLEIHQQVLTLSIEDINSIIDINKVYSESEMPVKDFTLLIVYLLVPLACNFAQNNTFASKLG